MTAPSYEPGRNALMLTELRLPTIGRLWSEFAERSDKEGWPASRFLGGLLEHELAERAKRRIERHRVESQLDATKTLASFDFAEVPMLSKACSGRARSSSACCFWPAGNSIGSRLRSNAPMRCGRQNSAWARIPKIDTGPRSRLYAGWTTL